MSKMAVSLKEMYMCEYYLRFGSTYLADGTTIPNKNKMRYIDEMHLEYSSKKHHYIGDADDVWGYFTSNYGMALKSAKIESYTQLVSVAQDSLII